jgi:hypothetical protein
MCTVAVPFTVAVAVDVPAAVMVELMLNSSRFACAMNLAEVEEAPGVRRVVVRHRLEL